MCGLLLVPSPSSCRPQRGDTDIARVVGMEVEDRLEVMSSAVDLGHSYVGTASAATTAVLLYCPLLRVFLEVVKGKEISFFCRKHWYFESQ